MVKVAGNARKHDLPLMQCFLTKSFSGATGNEFGMNIGRNYIMLKVTGYPGKQDLPLMQCVLIKCFSDATVNEFVHLKQKCAQQLFPPFKYRVGRKMFSRQTTPGLSKTPFSFAAKYHVRHCF